MHNQGSCIMHMMYQHRLVVANACCDAAFMGVCAARLRILLLIPSCARAEIRTSRSATKKDSCHQEKDDQAPGQYIVMAACTLTSEQSVDWKKVLSCTSFQSSALKGLKLSHRIHTTKKN